MKATYFYSRKQEIEILRTGGRRNYIDGNLYTTLQTQEGKHKSNWDDAIVVKVIDNLPLDEYFFKRFGKKHALTPSEEEMWRRVLK